MEKDVKTVINKLHRMCFSKKLDRLETLWYNEENSIECRMKKAGENSLSPKESHSQVKGPLLDGTLERAS